MKLKMIFFFCAILLSTSLASAHAPRDLEVAYSPENKTLTLKMIHVTDRPKSHYIRKVEIHRANGKVEKKLYYYQKTLKHVEKVFPLELNPGETVQIKAFCKKGGVLKESFTVPVEEKEGEENK